MTIKILKKEKNVLEVDLGEVDYSIAQIITERLQTVKGVEFAACKITHPVVGTPHLIVKTKGTDPLKLVTKEIGEVKKQVTEFKKQFSDIAK
jgi:DNA-directed RNA polymerase subunit L